jgi:hypothetical protein
MLAHLIRRELHHFAADYFEAGPLEAVEDIADELFFHTVGFADDNGFLHVGFLGIFTGIRRVRAQDYGAAGRWEACFLAQKFSHKNPLTAVGFAASCLAFNGLSFRLAHNV